MSSNFRLLNVNENCSNLTQIASANPSDTSHPTYQHINFSDPVSIRKTPGELMKWVGKQSLHISKRYKVQLETLYFEWERFILTLEKGFPDILNEMLSHNHQQKEQSFNSNEKRHILCRDREQYNNSRRGTNNRTRALTTPIPTMTHLNMTNRFHHFLHRHAWSNLHPERK